jgi:hypothetical protein
VKLWLEEKEAATVEFVDVAVLRAEVLPSEPFI